ncbi:MAG: hypothetical protein ACXVYM_03945 [Gaiellaceae bacterium]
MRATHRAADRRAVPVHLIRVDAIDALLEQGELDAANLLFECELELAQLPIGSACLRAVVRYEPQRAEELEDQGSWTVRILRRAIEQALPRGWVLLAFETRTHESARDEKLLTAVAAA